MKRVIFLLVICTALFSCGKDETELIQEESQAESVSLKVENDLAYYYFITSVKLVGYNFENLNIESGKSQTFQLDKGMPGGFEDINVIVTYKSTPGHAGWTARASIDFSENGVTVLRLSGCTEEGCDGIRLKQ